MTFNYTIWECDRIDQCAIVYGAPYNEKMLRGLQVGIYPTFNILVDKIQ